MMIIISLPLYIDSALTLYVWGPRQIPERGTLSWRERPIYVTNKPLETDWGRGGRWVRDVNVTWYIDEDQVLDTCFFCMYLRSWPLSLKILFWRSKKNKLVGGVGHYKVSSLTYNWSQNFVPVIPCLRDGHRYRVPTYRTQSLLDCNISTLDGMRLS